MLFHLLRNISTIGNATSSVLCLSLFLGFLFCSCSTHLFDSKQLTTSLNLGVGVSSDPKGKNYLVDRLPVPNTPLELACSIEQPSKLQSLWLKKRLKERYLESDSLVESFYRVRLLLLEINPLLNAYTSTSKNAMPPAGIVISNSFLVPKSAVAQLKKAQTISFTRKDAGQVRLTTTDKADNTVALVPHNWVKIAEEVRFVCHERMASTSQSFYQLTKQPNDCAQKINRKKKIKALIQ